MPYWVSRDKLAKMEPSPNRPSLGRRIALDLHSARPLTWVGPAWATICGGLASGALTLSGETLLRFAIAIILTDPILGAWRSAWISTDWRAPLRVWQPGPTKSWTLVPYARLDSPAARVSRWFSSRGRFWDSAVWPEVGQALSALVVSGLVALTIALVLGTPAFLVTIGALLLALVEAEMGSHGAGQWARGLGEIGAAWLIGHAAFAVPTWESAALALCFAVAYRGLLAAESSREFGFVLANVAQIASAVLLIARGALLNSGFIGLGLVGQNLWQAAARRIETFDPDYLPRVQWFVLATMLVAALGVPH